MANFDIDPEPGRADLRVGQEPEALDDVCDVLLEIGIRRQAGQGGLIQAAGLREVEEALEDAHAFAAGPARINVAGIERGKNLAAHAGVCEEHVQAAFAALAVHPAERHAGQPSAGDHAAVADAYEDDVALVALHILDVLDEHILGLPLAKEFVQHGNRSGAPLPEAR